MTDETKKTPEVQTVAQSVEAEAAVAVIVEEAKVEPEAKPVKAASPAKKKKAKSATPGKKHGKNYQAKRLLTENGKSYSIADAVGMAKKTSYVKFDATVELHLKLGVDPKKADQQVRGTVVLPFGTGKTVRILVIAEGDKVEEAKKAGADYVGSEDMIEKIKGGWLEFDLVIATPNMMGKIGPLGRILGTKGLMPSPKAGTVTFEVGRMVQEWKLGKVEYRLEKLPLFHTVIGKASFTEEQLQGNLRAVLGAIVKAKPASAKGMYIQTAFINATMGPGIKLDVQEVREVR